MSAASTGCRSAPTSRASAISAGPRKSGPTGKERIIYGTYTIYDTSDCRKNVEKANALEPRDAALEAAASAYAEAVSKLEPLLKEADDYYQQENYKDDKMAKGKALHPRLVAAWDAFASADKAAARRRRSHQRQARAGAARRDRAEGRQQGALSCRGADDPGQARAARAGHGEARPRRDHAGARPTTRAIVKAAEQICRQRQAAARSARCSSATPSRSSPRRSN